MSNSGNHVIFVLVRLLGTNILIYAHMIISLYKDTSFVLYIEIHLPLGAEPLANVSSYSQLGTDTPFLHLREKSVCTHLLPVLFSVRDYSSYFISAII